MEQKTNRSIIDEAIESYPLESLPEGFIASTMTKISQEIPRPSRMPFKFVDFVIPAFLGFFLLSTGWIVNLIKQSNPFWKIEILNFFQRYNPALPIEANTLQIIILAAILLTSFIGMIVFLIFTESSNPVRYQPLK